MSDIDGFMAAIACSISLADITRHRSRNRSALRLDCYSVAIYETFERLIAEREFEIPAILVAMSSILMLYAFNRTTGRSVGAIGGVRHTRHYRHSLLPM